MHVIRKEKCSQWASEKGAKIVFPPKLRGNSDRSASLCNISLRRSSQQLAGCVWPGLTTGGVPVLGQPPDLQPAFPAERPALPRTSSSSRWRQVREPLGRGAELHPSNPWEVGEVTPANSNCQLARQRRGKPGTEDRQRGEERGGRADEERRRMTRG